MDNSSIINRSTAYFFTITIITFLLLIIDLKELTNITPLIYFIGCIIPNFISYALCYYKTSKYIEQKHTAFYKKNKSYNRLLPITAISSTEEISQLKDSVLTKKVVNLKTLIKLILISFLFEILFCIVTVLK